MGDRHHYGPRGEYRGRSSNKGPWDDLFKIIGVVFVLVMFSRGCH